MAGQNDQHPSRPFNHLLSGLMRSQKRGCHSPYCLLWRVLTLHTAGLRRRKTCSKTFEQMGKTYPSGKPAELVSISVFSALRIHLQETVSSSGKLRLTKNHTHTHTRFYAQWPPSSSKTTGDGWQLAIYASSMVQIFLLPSCRPLKHLPNT